MFTLVKELCCAGGEVSCNLINGSDANPPQLHLRALQQKCAAPVYHAGVTLVVYIPKEQWRVTGLCAQYEALSAGQVRVRLSHNWQAKFKLLEKSRWDLITSRNAQVQTLGCSQSQRTLDQFDASQG